MFSKKWTGSFCEKQKDQEFVRDFLGVFGVDAGAVGTFQERTQSTGSTKWIDYLWKGKLAIEMKSTGECLDKALDQLRGYMNRIAEEDVPDLWMACDFETIRLLQRSTNQAWEFKTKDLRHRITKFSTLAGYVTERMHEEQMAVNTKASQKMVKLYEVLESHGYEGDELADYLVRLLFCMFADDTEIFPEYSFLEYIEDSKPNGSDLGFRIARLFEVLNASDDLRKKQVLWSEKLKSFRYINGALFEHHLPPMEFNAKMRQTLIECINFDWSKISPAIFGAMFQGIMDKGKRREIGAHYTSEENILKLIRPLFLDELKAEFERVKTSPKALDQFHEKLAGLKFLDPACGCGNFLIITYRELRRLELEVLKMKRNTGQMLIDIGVFFAEQLKVNVAQFYGIEIESFPCHVAQVSMWLMDHLMNREASAEFGQYYVRLPLKQSATIVHGNALRLDWENVVPKWELSYILGNPPFVGLSLRNSEQQMDMDIVFEDNNRAGRLDYVAAWYKKASKFIQNTSIRVAFVSTNSITQGEQVPILWRDMKESGSIIDFAYRTFKWSNEAKGKAAVHCVIIGFSNAECKVKRLFEYDDSSELTERSCEHINGYLLAATDIFIQTRAKALAGYPKITQGSKPWDGGFLIVSESEKDNMVAKHPESSAFIKQYIGSTEFINGGKRYCLWLLDVPPTSYRSIPEIMERLDGVKRTRQKTKTVAVQKQAETPMLFSQIRQPKTRYLAVPEISSENRKYIPIGFLEPDVIASNRLNTVADATLYTFGVLTSNVHMAWTRVVCGRLGISYCYTPAVYNNFPWPTATDEQKNHIETLAQAVLDARTHYPESSLADLYDPLTMPLELLKAHQQLDRAVMKLYGFPANFTEADIVAQLMELYEKLTKATSPNSPGDSDDPNKPSTPLKVA